MVGLFLRFVCSVVDLVNSHVRLPSSLLNFTGYPVGLAAKKAGWSTCARFNLSRTGQSHSYAAFRNSPPVGPSISCGAYPANGVNELGCNLSFQPITKSNRYNFVTLYHAPPLSIYSRLREANPLSLVASPCALCSIQTAMSALAYLKSNYHPPLSGP